MIPRRATVLAIVLLVTASPWWAAVGHAARVKAARNSFLDLFDRPSDSGDPKLTLHKSDVTEYPILAVKNGMLQIDVHGQRLWVNQSDVVTDETPAAQRCEGSQREAGATRGMGNGCR